MSQEPIKKAFIRGLSQLESLLMKVPESVFAKALTADAFNLAINARIACNFTLRGYCPLLGLEISYFDGECDDKPSILRQIEQTRTYLQSLENIKPIDNRQLISDKAGFRQLSLNQSDYLHQYILPNFYFHISTVYSIAKLNGIKVSKGDFDGYHSYPEDFSFVN